MNFELNYKSRSDLIDKIEKTGLTRFQKDVLIYTLSIPEGETRTYSDVARAIGHPNAFRAVGSALAKNPFAPDVPCHRVIRKDGGVGNYSGAGGVERKISLLKKEGAI